MADSGRSAHSQHVPRRFKKHCGTPLCVVTSSRDGDDLCEFFNSSGSGQMSKTPRHKYANSSALVADVQNSPHMCARPRVGSVALLRRTGEPVPILYCSCVVRAAEAAQAPARVPRAAVDCGLWVYVHVYTTPGGPFQDG